MTLNTIPEVYRFRNGPIPFSIWRDSALNDRL